MFCSQGVLAQGDHVSIGMGPSVLYGDNSGEYRAFKFKILPALTLSVNRQLNEYVGLRGSVGAQKFNSGGFDPLNTARAVNWGNQNQAFDFKGLGYNADIMPVFTTNPNAAGMLTSAIQFYIGLGIGAIYVQRKQEILKNGVIRNSMLVQGDIVKSNGSNIVPYVPIRTGLSTNLDGDWDYALEFILMTALNSRLDGNIVKTKTLKPDMIGQIQITVKRYFGPAW